MIAGGAGGGTEDLDATENAHTVELLLLNAAGGSGKVASERPETIHQAAEVIHQAPDDIDKRPGTRQTATETNGAQAPTPAEPEIRILTVSGESGGA
jgi:hypothetical protein